jgi:hypothetical protein
MNVYLSGTTTLSIMTFSRTALINNKNATFSITTLSILQNIAMLSIIYAECLEPFMLNVVMLSHAVFGSTFSKVPSMIIEI